MKVLTKEEEQEHYNAVVKGGTIGGLLGLDAGTLAVYAASKRFPTFQGLTLPFRTFLGASVGTFGAIINADRSSRSFEKTKHPGQDYHDEAETLAQQLEAQKSTTQRIKDWGQQNRYSLVFGSWVASMGIALGLVGRNPYLTGQQKLVQARVYAQGLTVAVLLASFALEANDAGQGKGRWETVKVLDPNDPTHKHLIEKRIHHERYRGEDQWMDMVEAEERRMKERAAQAAGQVQDKATQAKNAVQDKAKQAKDAVSS